MMATTTFTVYGSPAVSIRVEGGRLTNRGPATVYYADNQDLYAGAGAPAGAQGSLASGESAVLEGSQWLVAGTTASRADVVLEAPTTAATGGTLAMVEGPGGYAAREAGRPWFGWTDPTELMGELDLFYPIPERS